MTKVNGEPIKANSTMEAPPPMCAEENLLISLHQELSASFLTINEPDNDQNNPIIQQIHQLKHLNDETAKTKNIAFIQATKTQLKNQTDQAALFILELMESNLNKLIQINQSRLKKDAEEEQTKKSSVLRFYKKTENYIDIIVATSKLGSAVIKIIKFGAWATYEFFKPLTSTISLGGDVWGGFKAKIDITRIARKTSMTVAAIRIARSISQITLYALSISNPISFIIFLTVGALAGFYRDSYITYQNRQEIKKQESILAQEKSTLIKMKEKELSPENQKHQHTIIEKEQEQLNQLNKYRIKNNTRVTLDAISVIGAALTGISLLFPPLAATLFTVGFCIFIASACAKSIDKLTGDGAYKLITWLAKPQEASIQAIEPPKPTNTPSTDRRLSTLLKSKPTSTHKTEINTSAHKDKIKNTDFGTEKTQHPAFFTKTSLKEEKIFHYDQVRPMGRI